MSKRHKRNLAARADKHVLYEKSVQCVEAEIDFVDKTYRKLRKRKARVLKEDFCGTANTSCEWVRRRKDNSAFAVDIDPKVLAWSRSNNISHLKPAQRQRIQLINESVLETGPAPVDITLAMNFSYWVFKDRSSMTGYFRHVHQGLAEDGIFFLDAFGGYEAFQELEESTKYDGFTYVWEQSHYNPINGDYTCHIHFRFKDGSKLKKAFTYYWRLWTLPELLEMLGEAGFAATVYWEGSDK
ncbi:MAG: class I SAM-dependent methyltransferase, partial [bacterium]